MSFNKCFLNQDKIIQIYNESKSPERLRRYLNSYDAFICADDFSSDLIKVYHKLPDNELKKLLETLVD